MWEDNGPEGKAVRRTKENLAALKIQYEHQLQRLAAQEARCQDVDRQRTLHDLVLSGQDRLDLLKAEVSELKRYQ